MACCDPLLCMKAPMESAKVKRVRPGSGVSKCSCGLVRVRHHSSGARATTGAAKCSGCDTPWMSFGAKTHRHTPPLRSPAACNADGSNLLLKRAVEHDSITIAGSALVPQRRSERQGR